MGGAKDERARSRQVRAIVWRAALLMGAWWALTGGNRPGIVFGALVVLVATVTSLLMSKPSGWRVTLWGLVRLAWTFLIGSLRGGWDVSWRALSPKLPVNPRLIDHASALAPGIQRQIFSSTLTMMPGSLCIDRSGHDLCIHVLIDREDAFRRELATLEARVSRAFRVVPSDRRRP